MKIHEIHEQLKLIEPDWKSHADFYKSTVERYVNRDATILDIGCGRASFMCDVYSRAKLIIGQDPDALALSENNCVQKKLTGGLETLREIPNDSVDIAVTSWVLEHIDNPDLLMSEVGRVLKTGGVFISLTPNKKSLIILLSSLIPNFLHPHLVKVLWGRELRDTYPTKYKLNSQKEIWRYAAKYGFSVESIITLKDPTYYVSKLFGMRTVLNLYNKFISPERYEGLLFVLRKTEWR